MLTREPPSSVDPRNPFGLNRPFSATHTLHQQERQLNCGEAELTDLENPEATGRIRGPPPHDSQGPHHVQHLGAGTLESGVQIGPKGHDLGQVMSALGLFPPLQNGVILRPTS